MEKWKGKIAVVTGASSGIGAAIAKELASQGIIVVGLARRSEIIEEVDGKIYAYKCDVSDQDSIKSAFKWIEEKFNSISILVTSAGVGLFGNVLDSSDETTAGINMNIGTNFTGLVHCTREAIRLMNKSNYYGIILDISSLHRRYIPFPNVMSIYPATKCGAGAFLEIIRQELILSGNERIRVTNLSPGLVQTDYIKKSGLPYADHLYEKFPYLQPEDISAVVPFILSTPYNVNITEIVVKPVGEKF